MLLWPVFLLFLSAKDSVSQEVKCYAQFDRQSGTCGLYLGEIDQDDCCQNIEYGFRQQNGECESCGPPSWSEWSQWNPCTVTCLEGVKQRSRKCYGFGVCNDTQKLGDLQTKSCVEKPCCPEKGGWSEWGPWQACSVTCESGVRKRTRTCTQPAPQCGGQCSGSDTDTETCHVEQVCPIHGGWSEWGSWGLCPSSCMNEGGDPPHRQRFRFCTNPAPSSVPPGRPCSGHSQETQACNNLPFCPVSGEWGQWSPLSECSVTCGVGLRTKVRQCNAPAPRHGGQTCRGETTANELCNLHLHCPVDGQWSEWGPWENCKRSGKNIQCKYSAGMQRRVRTCLYRDFNGKACEGDIMDSRVCYNIEGCKLYGNWTEWGDWGLCEPPCGSDVYKTRHRTCEPDVSSYRLTVGTKEEMAYFSGKPKLFCPKGVQTSESKSCYNVPECVQP
ncbi:properdin [Arapaima gigas]